MLRDLDEISSHRNAINEDISELEFGAWIGGKSVRAENDGTFKTYDPATNEPIADVAECSRVDVDTAVSEGKSSFNDQWKETTQTERSELLFEWVETLRDHEDELVLLETLDTGKPIGDARWEVQGGIDTLEYYASIIRTHGGRQIQASNDANIYTRKEPLGVVGQITPWNFPMWAFGWKIGPALAAGNTAVLKPSKFAPLTSIRAAQLSEGILPDGVVNVVPGKGSEAGAAVSEHDEIQKVAFTGSVKIGKIAMKAAAENINPITLELGGKSPFIVFPDADLDKIISPLATGIFYSTGEVCEAASRAIVHEDIVDEFTERFVEEAESYVVGDPLAEESTMGPLTNKEQFESMNEYCDIGQQEGATLLTGGEPAETDLDGWFWKPTVFTDVENDMRIAQEEIFGPVQTILTFNSYSEAIQMANDTRYGLAAGVGTENTSIVQNAIKDLDAGSVWVNGYGPILPETPFGGFKDSGFGNDLGQEALDHYSRTKTVGINFDEPSI
ncbi:aldehyde dehydrogenase [Haloarcula sp. JP-L23]|uniref:aldehyde dehydrogenase family protein n=1 Tax=Haloarcula sp. JP-L23 TaxID=2716717 RepID=UPI00140F00CF|nr:aldehyde dehydrogenase [Haloarcula sp. JP-L23]